MENESQRSFVLENLLEARRLGADRALIVALQDSLDRSSSGLNMAPNSWETSAEMQRLEEEDSRLRLAIQAVRSSRSWRITHPLRSLTDAIRRTR
jgi:hypothetical protein